MSKPKAQVDFRIQEWALQYRPQDYAAHLDMSWARWQAGDDFLFPTCYLLGAKRTADTYDRMSKRLHNEWGIVLGIDGVLSMSTRVLTAPQVQGVRKKNGLLYQTFESVVTLLSQQMAIAVQRREWALYDEFAVLLVVYMQNAVVMSPSGVLVHETHLDSGCWRSEFRLMSATEFHKMCERLAVPLPDYDMVQLMCRMLERQYVAKARGCELVVEKAHTTVHKWSFTMAVQRHWGSNADTLRWVALMTDDEEPKEAHTPYVNFAMAVSLKDALPLMRNMWQLEPFVCVQRVVHTFKPVLMRAPFCNRVWPDRDRATSKYATHLTAHADAFDVDSAELGTVFYRNAVIPLNRTNVVVQLREMLATPEDDPLPDMVFEQLPARLKNAYRLLMAMLAGLFCTVGDDKKLVTRDLVQVLRVLACRLQHPYESVNKILWMFGEQGTLKSTFTRLLSAVWGPACAVMQSVSTLERDMFSLGVVTESFPVWLVFDDTGQESVTSAQNIAILKSLATQSTTREVRRMRTARETVAIECQLTPIVCSNVVESEVMGLLSRMENERRDMMFYTTKQTVYMLVDGVARCSNAPTPEQRFNDFITKLNQNFGDVALVLALLLYRMPYGDVLHDGIERPLTERSHTDLQDALLFWKTLHERDLDVLVDIHQNQCVNDATEQNTLLYRERQQLVMSDLAWWSRVNSRPAGKRAVVMEAINRCCVNGPILEHRPRRVLTCEEQQDPTNGVTYRGGACWEMDNGPSALKVVYRQLKDHNSGATYFQPSNADQKFMFVNVEYLRQAVETLPHYAAFRRWANVKSNADAWNREHQTPGVALKDLWRGVTLDEADRHLRFPFAPFGRDWLKMVDDAAFSELPYYFTPPNHHPRQQASHDDDPGYFQ